jgi:hypothetical protein
MDVLRRLRRQERCAHAVTVSVQTAGFERVVCEACGHVSVHFLSDLTGEVDRDRFARPIEREGKHQREDGEEEAEALVDVYADGPVVRSPHASLWAEPPIDRS